MFQRILVPLDGSLRAERAIPVAARLASASRSSIVLVRVIDVFLDFSWQMAGVSPDLMGALEGARMNADAYLSELAVEAAPSRSSDWP
jgi:nucleotide-binding universal stress UspA family protein